MLYMAAERFILKIEVDKDEFPSYVQVEEHGIKTKYEVTGFAYVQDNTVFVEYKISDIVIIPEKKKN